MADKLNPQNYYAVEFDPNLSLGSNNQGEFYLYRDYLNVVNEILDQEGQAPLMFDMSSKYVVDKRKNSSDLDHYNTIRDEVENTMNTSTLWNKGVPSVQKEKSINFWADKLYAVTKEVEKQTRGLGLHDTTKQTIDDLTGEYVQFLRPIWYDWATREHSEFANSKADGLGKGLVDFASGITRGVDINLPEILGGGDTVWGDWSESLRKRSEEMAQSTGMYNMSTDELLESNEYGKAFWVMMNHALTSMPQQIPSALSTIPALLGGGGPIGVGAMGLGLGAGYLQESGNFYEDVYDLYSQKRSRAKRLKGTIPDSEFNKRFGISIDMPDTKLSMGSFKTIDKLDDEQLRMMSEQLAQEYGGWSTGLELVNTIGDVWLGRKAGIIKNALQQNPKVAAKQWFKLHWSKPYAQQMGTEGATEFGQELVSEIKKEANVPEYHKNWTQMIESGIIGSMYGAGFQGVSDVASRIRSRQSPNIKSSDSTVDSFRKSSSELQVPNKIDDDIIVGLHSDPQNFTRKIAEHHDISEEEVILRMSELGELDKLGKSSVKRVLLRNPSILESYSNWIDPYPSSDPSDDMPGGITDEDPTLTGEDLGEFYDKELDDVTDINDPSVNAGLDIGDGHFDVDIEQEQIDILQKKITDLKAIDDPNIMARNVRDAKIEQHLLEIEQLKQSLNPEKAQNKRHKDLMKKEADSDELGIIGQSVILRTKTQSGKMGKILSYDGTLAKVKTNSGVYTISIRNLEFNNPTESINNLKKQASSKKGQAKIKNDSTTKKFVLKVAEQNKVKLSQEEKKLPLAKLRALVQSRMKGSPKKTKSSPKSKVKATASNSTTVQVNGTSYDVILKDGDTIIADSITGRNIAAMSDLGKKIRAEALPKLQSTETKEKGMTFSSFDQPIEVGDLKNTTTATISDLAYIRPDFETVLEAFKKSKKKTMKAFMSLAPRLIENYRLIKSKDGDILILEDGKAIGEIKADQTKKGLRTENLILGKGKNAIIVNNVVSVNNADTQVAKYNIPQLESKEIESLEEQSRSLLENLKQGVISSWGKVVQELKKTDLYEPWIPKKSQIFDLQINEGITEIILQYKSDAWNVLMLPKNKKIIEKVFKKVFGQDIKLKVITASESGGPINPGATESMKAERELEEGFEDPTAPDDLVDPFDEGEKSSETSLEQMDKLLAERDSNEVEEETIPEADKVKIVKKVVGKTLDDIVGRADDSDDVVLDNRIDGKPKIKMFGNERKKFEKSMELLWRQIKKQYILTDRNFADVVNGLNSYFANTPLEEPWARWSKTKIKKSGFRNRITEFGQRIQRAVGDSFTEGTIAGDEYQDVIESAIEHVRENMGMIEDSLENEPISVKDFTKISRTFFARYDFIIDSKKLKELIDKALTLIKEDPKTAYENLLNYYSTEENGLYTLMPRQTLAEVVATNPKAAILFKRFFNSIHPDNSGTYNRGQDGQIIEWTFRLWKNASSLEGSKRKISNFQASKEQGLDLNSRPTVSTLPFYTRFLNQNLFSFINGTDILTPFRKIYGFLNTNQMWNLYRDELVKRGLVIVASRGETDKMILTSTSEETNNAVKDISSFVKQEVKQWMDLQKSDPDKWAYISNFFKNIFDESNLDAKEKELLDHVFKGDYDLYREHWIAKHISLKKVFGSDYIFMKPETIMKRIKIPFTPVYTSDTLPDRRVMYFDANGATLNIKSPEGEKNIELTQMIDSTMQYIGDGQTITSERVFQEDYTEHFGGFENTKRAKTVQYNIDGDNVHMAKHQEMTLDLSQNEGAVLINNKGQEIAVIGADPQTGLINIYDMDGNDIDYLMSNDEAKIRSGNYSKNDIIHTLPGKSIGMIQFTPDSQKTKSKFSTQLSYYFDNEDFQAKIINKYISLDQGGFSPKKLIQKLIDWNSSGKKINSLIQTFSSRYFDSIPQNVVELAKLGVGRHPTVFPFLRDVLKKKTLKPLADFIMSGSHLDFRADFKGRVSQEETIIGPNNFFINKALDRMGKRNHIYRDINEKIADINEWLKTNKLYTMITRSPIASSMGFGIYDIKEIDISIGDSFILHPKEVKERFEGDHDHDTGHLTYLDEEFYNDLKPYVQKTRGLNITKYTKDSQNRDISSLSGTISMIRDMTYGETAIGEVVNAARYAGVLNSMFGPNGEIRLSVGGQPMTIKVRPLDMQVVDENIQLEDGSSFKGELRELLRLYLQASVDHPKVLLLRDWEYTQNNLLANLFYNPSSPLLKIDNDIVVFLKEGLINNVLKLNQQLDNMREGDGKSIKFKEIFNKSADYQKFINNREDYLKNIYADEDMEELLKKEEVLITYVGSVFKEGANGRPTSLQELISIIPDRVLDASGVPKERWYDIDGDTSRPVHRETVRQIKELVELSAQEENNGNKFDYTNAKLYAQKLSDALSELFNSKRNKDEKETDENSFINRMTPKTWDYSDDFIAFYSKWSEEFGKLSKPERIIATMAFLNGVATGLRSHQQLDIRMLPPVKESGPTSLDPDVMKMYFEYYNNNIDEVYSDSERLKEMRDVKPSQLVNEEKGAFNCA